MRKNVKGLGKWVETGLAVGDLYSSLRAEASDEARLRNKYFNRAKEAIMRGDSVAAKRLGAEGRAANERMKALHEKAADAIFAARNPSGRDAIDLHGLHVAEAIDRLPKALMSASGPSVRILTGTGHHTKGSKSYARLRPAVMKWLKENSYTFRELPDSNRYVGALLVQLGR